MLNVRPGNAVENAPNKGLVNAKDRRNPSLRKTGFGKLDNLWDVCFFEFREGVLRSKDKGARFNFVADVFFLCSDVKMIRVYASAIVALVENVSARLYLSAIQLPRKAMRGLKDAALSACSTRMKQAVSGVELRPNPFPAISRFFDFGEESFNVVQVFNHRQMMMTQGEL